MAGIPEFRVRSGQISSGPGVITGGVSQALDQMHRSVVSAAEHIEVNLTERAIREGEASGIEAGQLETLTLDQSNSARAQAFNAAAIKTFKGKQGVRISAALSQAYEQSKDNPGDVEAAFEDVRKEMLAGVPDTLVPDFDNQIDRAKIVALEQSGRLLEKRTLDDAVATATSAAQAKLKDLEVGAFSVSDLEKQTNLNAQNMAEYRDFLIQNGPRAGFTFDGEVFGPDVERTDAFSTVGMDRMMSDAGDRIVVSSALGRFDRAAGLPAKQEVRDGLRDAWEKGKLDITEQQLTQLENRMDGDIRQARTNNNAQLAGVKNRVASLNSLVEKGFDITSENWEAVQAEVDAAGDPGLAQALESSRALSEFQSSMRGLTPADMQLVVSKLRADMQPGVSDFQQVRELDVAEKLLSEASREIARDPLSWGNRVGVVALEPMSFAGPEGMASMQRRQSQAEAVASHYGIAPKYLTDEEATQVKGVLSGLDAQGQVDLVATVQQGFGEEAARSVFARLSSDNPMFGHAAGLMASGLAPMRDVALDMLTGRELRQGGDEVVPGPLDLESVVNDLEGGSLSFAGGTRKTVLDAAKNIYAVRALRSGITSSDDFDDDLFEDAMNMAVGGINVDGVWYGGFGDYSGLQTVLPTAYSQDAFDAALEKVTDDWLTVNGVRHGNGDVLTQDEFEAARLIPVGDGKYMIDLSENATRLMAGLDPSAPFVLDVRGLEG